MSVWKRSLINEDGREFGQEWAVQTTDRDAAVRAVAAAIGVTPDTIEDWVRNGDVWSQFTVATVRTTPPGEENFCPDCKWERV